MPRRPCRPVMMAWRGSVEEVWICHRARRGARRYRRMKCPVPEPGSDSSRGWVWRRIGSTLMEKSVSNNDYQRKVSHTRHRAQVVAVPRWMLTCGANGASPLSSLGLLIFRPSARDIERQAHKRLCGLLHVTISSNSRDRVRTSKRYVCGPRSLSPIGGRIERHGSWRVET